VSSAKQTNADQTEKKKEKKEASFFRGMMEEASPMTTTSNWGVLAQAVYVQPFARTRALALFFFFIVAGALVRIPIPTNRKYKKNQFPKTISISTSNESLECEEQSPKAKPQWEHSALRWSTKR
jgi:hypothetical protein